MPAHFCCIGVPAGLLWNGASESPPILGFGAAVVWRKGLDVLCGRALGLDSSSFAYWSAVGNVVASTCQAWEWQRAAGLPMSLRGGCREQCTILVWRGKADVKCVLAGAQEESGGSAVCCAQGNASLCRYDVHLLLRVSTYVHSACITRTDLGCVCAASGPGKACQPSF